MSRIKLKDLSPNPRMSKEELKKVLGGFDFLSPPSFYGSHSTTDLGVEIKVLENKMEEIRN